MAKWPLLARNMANEYFDYDNKYNFCDRDTLVLGLVILGFNQFWTSDLSVPTGQRFEGLE